VTKNIILLVKKRTPEEKAENKNFVPAVLYGKKIENAVLWVDRKKITSVIEEVGESTVFKVSLDGRDERNVLIKEVQRDIVDGRVIHVDFYQIRMDEEIEAKVELEFTGESPAVKDLGGILVKNLDEVEVKCLPGDLPSKIEVDVSRIKNFEDYIYIKDLPVSDKVEVLAEPETVVAMVSEPRSEEELAELETEVKEDITQVEGVMKEEKPEEGEAGEEKAAGAEKEEKEEKKEKE